MAEPLAIGVSARLLYPDPQRTGIYSKTLHYVEQSVAHNLMGRDAVVFLIPSHRADDGVAQGNIHVHEYVKRLDGLLLQGGSDIAPATYNETPLAPEWQGDRVRDLYELDLFAAFVAEGKPVLGICRGAQLNPRFTFRGGSHADDGDPARVKQQVCDIGQTGPRQLQFEIGSALSHRRSPAFDRRRICASRYPGSDERDKQQQSDQSSHGRS